MPVGGKLYTAPLVGFSEVPCELSQQCPFTQLGRDMKLKYSPSSTDENAARGRQSGAPA